MRRLLPLLALVAALPVQAQDARPVTGNEMRAEARTMAAGDPALLAAIDAAEAEGTRGVLGSGPVSIRHRVPGGASWSLPLTRRAGEPTSIAVRRIGGDAVALTILDASGKSLCADDSGGAVLQCRIAPGTGRLVARIENRGSAQSELLLITN